MGSGCWCKTCTTRKILRFGFAWPHSQTNWRSGSHGRQRCAEFYSILALSCPFPPQPCCAYVWEPEASPQSAACPLGAHGRELISSEVAMRLARMLCGEATSLFAGSAEESRQQIADMLRLVVVKVVPVQVASRRANCRSRIGELVAADAWECLHCRCHLLGNSRKMPNAVAARDG